MISQHTPTIQTQYKKKNRSYLPEKVLFILEKMSDMLEKDLLDNGFSANALTISDQSIEVLNFVRIKRSFFKGLPILQFNTSTTLKPNWIEMNQIPAFIYAPIGEPFNFGMIESQTIYSMDFLNNIYQANQSKVFTQIKNIATKAIMLNFKRTYKHEGIAEHLVDSDIDKAFAVYHINEYVLKWLEDDIYFQQRLEALTAVLIQHVQNENYFDKELKTISDKLFVGSLYHYTELLERIGEENHAEFVRIANTSIHSAIVYAEYKDVKSLLEVIDPSADNSDVIKSINSQSPAEFREIIGSLFILKLRMNKPDNEFKTYLTLSIMYGTDTVARYSRLIDLVLATKDKDLVERLYVIFKLLREPSTFTNLMRQTMPDFLVNAQTNDSIDLNNFLQINSTCTPVMLNGLAQRYELQRFIQNGTMSTFFKFKASNTIFTDAVFNGAKIQNATIQIISNNRELLELCKDTDQNLNHLSDALKNQYRYLFRITLNDQVYPICLDCIDEIHLQLNHSIVEIPNLPELQEVIQCFVKHLASKTKFIKKIA